MQILSIVTQILFIYLSIGLIIVSILLGMGSIQLTETVGFFVGIAMWPVLVIAVVRKRIKR